MKSLLLFSFLLASPAFAISFYHAKDGKIVKIDKAAFAACSTIVYRESAKDELPDEHKRKLVSALLKGKAVNDLGAAIAALKGDADACSYGTDAEKFE